MNVSMTAKGITERKSFYFGHKTREMTKVKDPRSFQNYFSYKTRSHVTVNNSILLKECDLTFNLQSSEFRASCL